MSELYPRDLTGSARRHLLAADRLIETDRVDVAGYLYGWAAECALKQIMFDSGMRELAQDKRRDDPFYAHFEALREMLKDRAYGRRADVIRRFVDDSRTMQYWATDMRYSNGRGVKPDWVAKWQVTAQSLIAEMEL